MGAMVTVAAVEPAGGEEMPNTGQGAVKPGESGEGFMHIVPCGGRVGVGVGKDADSL